IKGRALANDMIAVMQAWCSVREQSAEPLLPLAHRPRAEILAVEIEKIEQEEDQRRRVAAVRSELHDVEGGDAVGTNAAEFTVDIGLPRIERSHGFGERRVFGGPSWDVGGEQ